MEEFKVCERETKTKAYSREGLAKAGKIDPEERKRLDSRAWVQQAIAEIQRKVDNNEFAIEELENEENNNDDEIHERQEYITNHKWHILKLEHITRALDNRMLGPDEVDDMKDDIDYYLEFGEEPDYPHDDELYDNLGISSKEYQTETTAVLDNPPAKEKKKKKDKTKSKKKKKITDKDSQSTTRRDKPTAHEKLLAQQQERMRLLAAEEKKRKDINAKETEEQIPSDIKVQSKNYSQMFTNTNVLSSPSTLPSQTKSLLVKTKDEKPQRTESISGQSPISSPRLLSRASAMSTGNTNTATSKSLTLSSIAIDDQLDFLETSLLHLPDVFDADEYYEYTPDYPFAVPFCFPSNSSNAFNKAEQYVNMDLETLIFIFYNKQGTFQQYLAGKELKRRSWRYNIKEKTWFIRKQEPTVKKSDYEVGNYYFFDTDAWKKILKENVKLEYRYVEMKLAT